MKIDATVKAMRPRRYTAAQAAVVVGRSVDTVRRWKSEGIYVPSESRKFGSLDVDLYTPDDIRAMKALVKTIKPGRKALPEPAEPAA